jgi:hypothetical protein
MNAAPFSAGHQARMLKLAMLIFCNTPEESQRGPIVGIVTL